MPDTIPLFPLGSVLFPGVLLPLHIFEPRYRRLVQDLIAVPEGEPRRFGVIAIRQGWEVGADRVDALHPVGCTAEVRRIHPHPDGRYDVVGVGAQRFRLLSVDDSTQPYLTGSVQWLPAGNEDQSELALLARMVAERFRGYAADVAALQRRGGARFGELPDDPQALSYLIASAALLTLEDRQELLEECSVGRRLRREARLLRRESTIVRMLRAVPVPLIELNVPRSGN